jgi:phosphoglucosamine mutase
MGKLFGTDGIRGAAGEYPLDASTVYQVGCALAELGIRRVLIGRDTRASGVWIERLLQQAVSSNGGGVLLAGVITTPGVSYLSKTGPFEAGVMISASHNPYRDNGIKIFSHSGMKLLDQEEHRIEEILENSSQTPPADMVNIMNSAEQLDYQNPEWIGKYAAHLKETAVHSLHPFKVVLDCANGAASSIAPEVFADLGANVVALNRTPNGCNINDGCGALHPEKMAEAVTAQGASFGVAFDGDSDRSIFADERGSIVDGDHVLYVLARYLQRRGRLASSCVVSTVMANLGLETALGRDGIKMLRSKVGDRYVLEEMLKGDYSLGGEQSGHIIIRDHSVTGDGILTALMIAQVMIEEGKSLAELCRGFEKFPQVLRNVRVIEKRDFSRIPEIQSEIQEVERTLGEKGRILVRYSGTEPLVRIMLEGEDLDQISCHADNIAGAFREALGTGV